MIIEGFGKNETTIEKQSLDNIKNTILAPDVVLVLDFDETVATTAHLQRESYAKTMREILDIDFKITEEFGRTKLRGKNGADVFKILCKNFGSSEDDDLITEAV